MNGDHNMKRIPIVLDTDPGVDDAVCLALTVAYGDTLDLKAVTTIGGNNYTSVTTQNALDLLQLYGSNTPVYPGEDSYLKEEFAEPVAKFHGANGLGDANIPSSNNKPENKRASEAIYQIAKECNGELVLVTVGPETNLGKAFLDHPDLKSFIKKIVVMGGGVHIGNITKYAEANVGHDRYAADIVFSSGIPIDMIGLNVTKFMPLPRRVFEDMSTNTREDVREFILKLIDFRNGEPMHDAIAMATLVDDSFITWQNSDVHIELNDEIRFGETVVKENPNGHIRVAMDFDLEKYYRIFSRIAEYYQ